MPDRPRDSHGNPVDPAWSNQARPPGSGSAAPPPKDPGNQNVFAGSSYGADQNVGATNVTNWSKSTDPRDFMYGRDPNYAANTAAAERAHAGQSVEQLTGQAAAANIRGEQMGSMISGYGQQMAAGGQAGATRLQGLAGNTIDRANAMQGRQGAQANYQGANSVYQVAKDRASQLAGLEAEQGPSAAQAQLQTGLNAAEASNLAMARSGRGWGGSASALSQAATSNAAAGQQAANTSASLKAQEDAAWRQRQASNLAGAAGISTAVGGAQQQQALTQAQLQQQTIAQNDQAQAALNAQGLSAYGTGLGAYNQAGALGLEGVKSGVAATQAGETLDLQGTQAAAGAYAQGEQMAGLNMSAQQQGDLARESGLLTQEGISQGLAVSNQNAINSGWGTAANTAATIGAVALSDATAKTDVKPLDATTQPPEPASSSHTTVSAPAPKANPWLTPALQVGGAAIGTAIAPGIGTAIGGLAGNLAGKLLSSKLTSDIHTKETIQPIDSKINPSGSTQAGADNAMSSRRESAATAANAAVNKSDLEDAAKQAAAKSMMLDSAEKVGGVFGGGQDGMGTLNQFQGLAPRPQQYYGMPVQWGQFDPMVTSDAHSKTAIKRLAAENQVLKAAVAPTHAQLDQELAAQMAARRGAFEAYPENLDDRQAPSRDMLNQEAAAQSTPHVANRVYRPSAALDMVDAAPGYSYEYKNPARHGYGQKFGPMAQDLLKTPVGASTVERAPDGTLAVNTGRLALAEHAALHSMRKDNEAKFDKLNAELDALNAKVGSAPSQPQPTLSQPNTEALDEAYRRDRFERLKSELDALSGKKVA